MPRAFPPGKRVGFFLFFRFSSLFFFSHTHRVGPDSNDKHFSCRVLNNQLVPTGLFSQREISWLFLSRWKRNGQELLQAARSLSSFQFLEQRIYENNDQIFIRFLFRPVFVARSRTNKNDSLPSIRVLQVYLCTDSLIVFCSFYRINYISIYDIDIL